MEPKKKVLSFLMGPPKLHAPSFRRKTGPVGNWKMFRDWRTLSVWNQLAVPWKSLVPCFVTTLTFTEELRPDSAEKLFVETRTSWTESALGLKLVSPPWATLLVEAEFTAKLLLIPRWPFALSATPYSVV